MTSTQTCAQRLRRLAPRFLLAGWVLLIFVVTLTPRMPASSTVGSVVTRVLQDAHERGIVMWVDFLVVEFAGNIVMFVPVGVLTAVVLGRGRPWLLWVCGTVLSGFVELTQLLFLPSRFSELRDIVSNSIGYLLGVGSVLLIRSIMDRRRLNRHQRAMSADSG